MQIRYFVLLFCVVLRVDAEQIFVCGFEPLYLVGGTAPAAGIPLQLNKQTPFDTTGSGAFVFPQPIEDGSAYVVTLQAAPAGQDCVLQNSNGVINGADVIDLMVSCGQSSTIYDVKQGLVSGTVAIQDVQVVACLDGLGRTVQTLPGDVDYQGDDFSGVYLPDATVDCLDPQLSPKIGDRTDLVAEVSEFFGQTQLINAIPVVTSSGHPAPSPVLSTSAALGTMAAAPLEAVLVRIELPQVTSTMVPPGPGDTDPTQEYLVDGQLQVDDLLYLTTPFPEVNDVFPHITGIMTYRNNASKLLPRYSPDAFIPLVGADHLVINEVDYDQTGQDTLEFVELFNPTDQTISLQNMSLYLVNGTTSSEYDRIDLDAGGALLSGQYAVVGSELLLANVDQGVVTEAFVDATNALQNGPDGLLLIDRQTELVADVLSYEGSVTATITDLGDLVVDLVEGTATPEVDSGDGALVRQPDGQDSDDASIDWVHNAVTSPGGPGPAVNTDPTGLVINEVDYDQSGSDTTEFIELYNSNMHAISLNNLSLYLVNGGTNLPYLNIDLSTAASVLEAGQFLVISTAGVAVDPQAVQLNFANATNNIQNGAPDGVLIFNEANLSVVDALSYEGSVTAADINGTVVNLVEGVAATAIDSGNGSLIRLPDGADSDQADNDWSLSLTMTPGAPNQ